jgi:hypothetical protein
MPGFGTIEPDKVTVSPRLTVLGDVKEIVVEGRVNVVSVVDVLILVEV